jgi:hypothetical protein
MKNILFIFLLIPLISIGQDKEIVELRNEINTVKDNLHLHHQQFRSGFAVSILGFSATIVGGIIPSSAVVITGGIMSLIGFAVMVDSDKYFGKKYMNKTQYQTERQINIFGGKADKTGNSTTILQTNSVPHSHKKIEIQHHNWTIRHILKRELSPFDEVEIITGLEDAFYTYSGTLLRHGLNKLSLKNKKDEIIKIKYNRITEIYKIQ